MSLRLQRVALAAAFVGASASAANLAEDCKSGLELLQGQSDFELAARCRASFSPEVCRQAGRTLGNQPWSSEHMDKSCARFAAAYSGTDARGLEVSVARKAATMPKLTPLEEATSQKKYPTGGAEPTPASQQPREGNSSPGGLIRHLLDKVGDGKKAEEGKEAKEAKEVDDKVESAEPPNDLESEAEEPTDVQKEAEEGKEVDDKAESAQPPNDLESEAEEPTDMQREAEEGKEAKEAKEVDDKAESAEPPNDLEPEAEEPTDLQKGAKAAVELDTKAATQREMMAPTSKKAATEIESLKSDVKRDLGVAEKSESHPLEKTETDGAVELFGQLGSQPGQEGSPREALPGLLLFTASAAFVTLAVLRRRRIGRGREAFLDLEQDASPTSPILE